jgi:hypothetical protein
MTSKLHIDISAKNNVSAAASGSGKVSGTTWTPGTGAKQNEDMARANQIAFEQMVEAERLANNPELQRIIQLEKEMDLLKAKFITFEDLYGSK